MVKWTLFACGLLAFSATACAQEPSKPAPEPSGKAAPATSAASPLVVSASRKLDLDAKDPKGLLLKLNGPKPGYLRLEWGATRQALVQAMASLSGQPVDGALRCSDQHGETLCMLKGESAWWGEPGLASMDGELPVAFLFSPAGELYHYTLLAAKEGADAVRSALEKDFGAPAREDPSPRRTLWNLSHVSVVVQEGSDVTEIHVVYVPIAEKTQ